MTGWRLARAAQRLVGCPFRLQGRDPATGLDCVGLLDAALRAVGQSANLPRGYTLRLAAVEAWLPDPLSCGFRAATGAAEPGDVILLAVGAGQAHLAIAACDGGWLHAHASVGRIVHDPQRPAGSVLHHWRLAGAE